MTSPAANAGRPALLRVWALAAVMTAAAVPLHVFALRHPGPVAPFPLPWGALAVGFLLTEIFVIHLHVKRDAHTASLSEIPLLLGLAAASPAGLLAGRLVGAGWAKNSPGSSQLSSPRGPHPRCC